MASTTPDPHPCAASSLLARLLDGPVRPLVEAARTRLSVHYETGDPALPVLSVCSPQAVRLPNAVVTSVLPGPGLLTVGAGMLGGSDTTWRVGRWWAPPKPTGLAPPPRPVAREWAVRVAGDPAVLASYPPLLPAELVGAGPGLTPTGDDVLAGALVTAHATADPRLPRWRHTTRVALATRRTTVVSRALLHHALQGYAGPELADAVVALCAEADPGPAVQRLLGVGHTSGAALLHGVLHTLTTRTLRGAA